MPPIRIRFDPSARLLNLPKIGSSIHSDGILQFGLVAEEVEKVNSELVVRDEDGKVNTVRYEAVNAMLLNEFLKERRKAQAEGRKVAQLEATVAKQQKQIEALTAGLQKVSARLEMNKPAPQLMAENQ